MTTEKKPQEGDAFLFINTSDMHFPLYVKMPDGSTYPMIQSDQAEYQELRSGKLMTDDGRGGKIIKALPNSIIAEIEAGTHKVPAKNIVLHPARYNQVRNEYYRSMMAEVVGENPNPTPEYATWDDIFSDGFLNEQMALQGRNESERQAILIDFMKMNFEVPKRKPAGS